MKFLKIALASLSITLPLQALAFSDGNALLTALNSQNRPLEAMALAYITGLSDGLLLGHAMGSTYRNGIRIPNSKPRYPYCVPEQMTNKQANDVVHKYLQDTPSDRHMPNSSLVLSAMEKAFPCDR